MAFEVHSIESTEIVRAKRIRFAYTDPHGKLLEVNSVVTISL